MHPFIESLEYRRLLSTYYVDLSGSDANDGLSPAAAFATISKVNSLDLEPADTVLFNGGQSFNGTLTLGANDSGTAASPVSLGSYGTGNAIINSGLGYGLYSLNASGISVSNLNFIGTNQPAASSNGIWFETNLPGNIKLPYIHIDSVSVSGFGNDGITIGGSNGKSGFDDVRITGSNVFGNKHDGIETHGVFSATATGYANSHVYIGHNFIHDNSGYARSPNHSGSGILLSDVQYATVERNVASYNGAQNTHVGGPVGIWAWDSDNVTLQYNESHHNLTNSTADGGGFDFDGGVTNSIMQYNYSHDNAGAGYGIYQFSGARPLNNLTIRYNISQNDGRKNGYGAVDFWNGNGNNGINNVAVFNNTIYLSPAPSGTPKALRFQTAVNSVSIRNNIFQTTSGVQLAEIGGKQPTLSLQGNDYWTTGGAFSLKVFAKTYSSFSAYVAATGYEKLNGVTVGKNVDPLLNAAGTAGTLNNADLIEASLDAYKLQSTSALRMGGLNLFSNFGIDMGPHDLYGNVLTDPYSVGANEA